MNRPTSEERASSAQICRDRLWIVGDTLIADCNETRVSVQITAIGTREILVRSKLGIALAAEEYQLDLRIRDWNRAN